MLRGYPHQSFSPRAAAILAGGLMLVAGLPLAAQQTSPATIARPCRAIGRVTAGDDALPGVTITAKAGDKVVALTSTDLDGNFSVPLAPGTYTLRLELPPSSPSIDRSPRARRPVRCSRMWSCSWLPGRLATRPRRLRRFLLWPRRLQFRRLDNQANRLPRNRHRVRRQPAVADGKAGRARSDFKRSPSSSLMRVPRPVSMSCSTPPGRDAVAPTIRPRDCCRRGFRSTRRWSP